MTHTPGEIGISLMWHETRIDQSGQSCVLVYDATTGEPREMLIARQQGACGSSSCAWATSRTFTGRHRYPDREDPSGPRYSPSDHPSPHRFNQRRHERRSSFQLVHIHDDPFFKANAASAGAPRGQDRRRPFGAVIGQETTLAALATAVQDQLHRSACQRALKLPHLWAFNFPYLMGVAVSGDQPVG